MPHTTAWYIEKRIIYFHINGIVTMDEVEEVNAEILALIEAGDAPVHLIVNDANAEKMPINIRELSTQFAYVKHPKTGYLVGAGETNMILAYIIRMVAKTIGVNIVRRKTFADVIDYLRKLDSTLNWEDANDGVLIEPQLEV